MGVSSARRAALEIAAVIVLLATFEALKKYRRFWRTVREQMESELDTILEGRAT